MKSSLLLLVVACGSSGAKQPDAPMVDAPTADTAPIALHYRYIVDWTNWPTTTTDASTYAFDLDGDGMRDNAVGAIDAVLTSHGIDVVTPQIVAISRGDVLMLADLQTTSLTTAGSADYTMYVGTNPNPPPCNGSNDSMCRHHLTGTGTFDVAAAPRDLPLTGSVTNGVYVGGPGHLSMQLSVAGGVPVTLTLLAAHAGLVATSNTIMEGTLAGAITTDDLQTKVYPAMQTSLAAVIAHDCLMPSMPPQCGCYSGSQGASAISLFDADHDCAVTAAEIQNNSLLQPMFQPDVNVEGQMALSVGFRALGVAATFTP